MIELDQARADEARERERARRAGNGAGKAPPHGTNGASAGKILPLKYWRDLETITPPDRLIRRLLGTTSFAVIYGETGSGKTFFATFLGLHIALGWDCFGRKVERGAVLYVAAEGAAGLTNRIKAFRLATTTPEAVPFVVVPKAIDIGPNGPDTEALIATVREVERETGLPVVAIVLDTLARSIGAGDESLAQDMGAYVMRCDRVRIETGATMIIVHHTGKNTGNGPRGSSALKAAADTVIAVEKRDGVRVATVEKQKDGADGAELAFRLDVVAIGLDDDGADITSCIVVPSDEAAPAARATVSGQARTVLDALKRAILEGGKPAPASRYIPPGVTVATVTLWRAYADQMLGEIENTESRAKAIRRAMSDLKTRGLAAMDGDHAWLV